MKAPVLCALALSLGLVASGHAATGDEQKPAKTVPAVVASPKITSGVSLPEGHQLYKPGSVMKLSKSSPPKALTLSSRSDAIPTFDPISSDLEAFKRAVTVDHQAGAAHSRKARECWDKDYTQADQAAAGCRATETVAVCYEKLAVACATPTLVSTRNARSALDAAHSKLKNTLAGYRERLDR